eukprot:Ihof_evm8s68 gene=Ihof_evmTU8s68
MHILFLVIGYLPGSISHNAIVTDLETDQSTLSSDRPVADGSSLVFGLCTASVTDNRSTHTYDYCFMNMPANANRDSVLEKMHISIGNLDLKIQKEYDMIPVIPAHLQGSGSRPHWMDALDAKMLERDHHFGPENMMETAYKGIIQDMKSLKRQLVKGEAKVCQLQREIEDLRKERACDFNARASTTAG